VHPLDANLISSQKVNGKHTLFLDLDQEHFIAPSTTEGHSHIYINTDLSTDALKEIIGVLAKHGVVQEGIKKQLDTSGFLTFRPPGVKKYDQYDDAGLTEAKTLEQKPKDSKPNFFPLFPKIQGLKDQLKSNKKDLKAKAITTAIQSEALFLFLDILVNALELNSPLILGEKDSFDQTVVKYEDKRLFIMRYNMLTDTYNILFYRNDIEGKHENITWEKVVMAVQTFGGNV
jgi:hypothetical protein